ncbi:hypothetical protein EVAR_101381_1 [Eumeta japonica]|uniref:CCHC-type domain-containing protein n=1 Tax=Eumeta variegata TaxID=151549 RepID=A0A4C1SI55_EUMVA|nr:hypothetical protein EVAR_101381_1 [Eumeta japonica]
MAHQLHKFYNYKLSPVNRLNFAQREKLCVNCLRSGHTASTCKSEVCRACKQKHNSLLHLKNIPQQPKQGSSSERKSQTTSTSATTSPETNEHNISEAMTSSPEAPSVATASGQASNTYILLSTALVKIKTDTIEIGCRTLLDSG